MIVIIIIMTLFNLISIIITSFIILKGYLADLVFGKSANEIKSTQIIKIMIAFGERKKLEYLEKNPSY